MPEFYTNIFDQLYSKDYKNAHMEIACNKHVFYYLNDMCLILILHLMKWTYSTFIPYYIDKEVYISRFRALLYVTFQV